MTTSQRLTVPSAAAASRRPSGEKATASTLCTSISSRSRPVSRSQRRMNESAWSSRSPVASNLPLGEKSNRPDVLQIALEPLHFTPGSYIPGASPTPTVLVTVALC